MGIEKSILNKLVDNAKELTEIDLSNQDLSVNDINELIKALSANTFLKLLNVSSNPLGNEGIEILISSKLSITKLIAADCNVNLITSLGDNKNIVELDLTGNTIGPEGAEHLARSNLKSLWLTGNQIKCKGISYFSKNNTIEYLNVSRNEIRSEGAEALSKNKTLRILVISYNMLQNAGAIALSKSYNITELYLCANNIGYEGVIAFGQSRVSILDLSSNQVDDTAVDGLSANLTIKELNLGYNKLTHLSAKAIYKMHLISLTICYNNLGNIGSEILARHKTLKFLDLTSNKIQFAGIYPFVDNDVLLTLVLGSNNIGDAGGIVLAQNKTLKVLILRDTGLSDSSAIVFSNNKTLDTLNLNYNSIKPEAAEKLKLNKSIKNLILSEEQPPVFTEDNFETIFLLSDNYLCIYDLQGYIQFFNPAFSKTLGYSTDEIITKSSLKFIHPKDQQLQIDLFSEANPSRRYVNRFRCKDNSFRNISWSIHLKNGRIYATGNDITEQLTLENKVLVEQHKNSIKLLIEERNNSESQAKFIADLSHEIRNPLNSIFGLILLCKDNMKELGQKINMLFTNETDPVFKNKISSLFTEINDYHNNLSDCAEHQHSILNENLDLVKIGEGKLVLAEKPFEIIDTLNEILSIAKSQAVLKGLTMDFVSHYTDSYYVLGDKLRFKQVILNLVSNAIKFTHEGGVQVVLKSILENSNDIAIEIEIVDSGIGISINDQIQLFNRFSQASASVGGEYGGSGLGLYLGREMARAMNGDVRVTSELGKYSKFTVTFQIPAYKNENKKEEDVNSDSEILVKKYSPLTTYSTFSKSNLIEKNKILVAEDNLVNQKVVVRLLEKAGYECRVANDGQQAVYAAQATSFTAILMDIMMPTMDGLKATRAIRLHEAENNLKRIPIFGLSANALVQDRQKAIESGMDDYFHKPLNIAKIIQKIKCTISQPTLSEPILSLQSLTRTASAHK